MHVISHSYHISSVAEGFAVGQLHTIRLPRIMRLCDCAPQMFSSTQLSAFSSVCTLSSPCSGTSYYYGHKVSFVLLSGCQMSRRQVLPNMSLSEGRRRKEERKKRRMACCWDCDGQWMTTLIPEVFLVSFYVRLLVILNELKATLNSVHGWWHKNREKWSDCGKTSQLACIWPVSSWHNHKACDNYIP